MATTALTRLLLFTHRRLQGDSVLCSAIENELGLTCTCEGSNSAQCESNATSCEDGTCSTFEVSFTFAEDGTVATSQTCIKYVSNPPDEFETACIDMTAIEPTTCGLSLDGTTCTACRLCSENDWEVDCSNIGPGIQTDGCESFDVSTVVDLFPEDVTTTSGVVGGELEPRLLALLGMTWMLV